MTNSLGQMKETIDQLVIEDGPSEENETQLEIAAKMDERSTEQSDKKPESGSADSNSGAKNPTRSEKTEQSINLINQGSESQPDAWGKMDLLSSIANDLKLDQKKAPAVNEHIAQIFRGLLREKVTDEVLSATQNRYDTPENSECITSTKANYFISDELKPDTRSADIKLQSAIQSCQRAHFRSFYC